MFYRVQLAGSFNVSSLKISCLSSPRFVSFNIRLLSLSIPRILVFLSIRLASTLAHQSGNPGIMNSQLSLAIPALPANTTLHEFAQLLAWPFSDRE
jgi:hypothetical protein